MVFDFQEDYTTQLNGDYNKPTIRIPSKRPVFHGDFGGFFSWLINRYPPTKQHIPFKGSWVPMIFLFHRWDMCWFAGGYWTAHLRSSKPLHQSTYAISKTHFIKTSRIHSENISSKKKSLSSCSHFFATAKVIASHCFMPWTHPWLDPFLSDPGCWESFLLFRHWWFRCSLESGIPRVSWRMGIPRRNCSVVRITPQL